MNLKAILIVAIVFGSAFFTFQQGRAATDDDQPDVGQRAIDFELPIVHTEGYLTLSDSYKSGPSVVIFLRGFPEYQCPECSRQVSSLINHAEAFRNVADRVVLVYPGNRTSRQGKRLERQAEQFLSSRKLPAPFVLVRDDDMKVVEQWGLRWTGRRETAYPATFVIDQNGRIAWKQVSRTHFGRSSATEILRQLRNL